MNARIHAHLLVAALAFGAGAAGCSVFNGELGDGRVVLVDDCCGVDPRENPTPTTYFSYVWRGDRVWGASPLRQLTLGRDFRPVSDTVYAPPPGSWEERQNYGIDSRVQGRYVTADAAGERLLIVRSNSSVTLFEPGTGHVQTLIDSTEHISTVVFDPFDQNRVVYYSYGRDLSAYPNSEAGFYALDLRTGLRTLLLQHARLIGPNTGGSFGFDLSPDGRTLLYPEIRRDAPRVIQRELASGQADTLDVPFPHPGLWLRYHPGGRHALYANSSDYHASELGVLDLTTGDRRVIDVRYPGSAPRSGSRVLTPVWSPDGRHALVGRGFVGEGVGAPSLYVIKDVM